MSAAPKPTFTKPFSKPSAKLAQLALMFAVAATLTACGGGGSSEPAPPPPSTPNPPPSPPPPSPSGTYVLYGKATFDSVPGAANGGLNYAGTVAKPIRGATVEALSTGGTVLSTATTDANGDYSLSIGSQQTVSVRVRAELKGGNFNFAVRDNTAGNAMYVLDSSAVTVDPSNTNLNVRASSGWGGSAYTSTRSAGPFAILDAVYQAKEKVVAAQPGALMTPLNIYWSVNNVAISSGTENVAAGQLQTTYFMVRNGAPGLYILGKADNDTDEYDSPVIAHEFGHYLQYALFRDDSVGGAHRGSDKLDMRVAFSEGWGNAWAGMALDTPTYRDSSGSGQASGFAYSLNTAPSTTYQGWFNELTVQYLLYQSYQDASIGFGGIYSAMAAMRNSPAFTTIHNFNTLLKSAVPASAATITTRSAAVGVNGTDIYGANETNNGGLTSVLPIYKVHTAGLGASQEYCVTGPSAQAADGNKLGPHVYVKFTTSGTRTITVTRSASTVADTDPDLMVVKSDGSSVSRTTGTLNVESIAGSSYPAGTHVIAINDYNLADASTRCFAMRID